MIYFLDTEFNGFGGELLSIALVPLEGERFFYEVVDNEGLEFDSWVLENVVPLLRKDPISYAQLQNKLAVCFNGDPNPIVIADWPDDIRYFCQLMITGPGTMRGPTNIEFRMDRSLSCDSATIRHNALSDATALRDDYLRKQIK